MVGRYKRGTSGPACASIRVGVLLPTICSKLITNLLKNFHMFLATNRFFSKFKILTLKVIPAIPLPWFKRQPFGLPVAYSRKSALFLICSKMATDLLENCQAKNLYFQNQFSPYHITFICYYIADYIKRPWNFPLHTCIVWYS